MSGDPILTGLAYLFAVLDMIAKALPHVVPFFIGIVGAVIAFRRARGRSRAGVAALVFFGLLAVSYPAVRAIVSYQHESKVTSEQDRAYENERVATFLENNEAAMKYSSGNVRPYITKKKRHRDRTQYEVYIPGFPDASAIVEVSGADSTPVVSLACIGEKRKYECQLK